MSAAPTSNVVFHALPAGCTVLYTEDLQHRQVIEWRLTLVNPFLPVAAP